MIKATCTQRFRDKQGKIIEYELMDMYGKRNNIDSDRLKQAIKRKEIEVNNLVLTSDNRLLHRKPVEFSNKSISKEEKFNRVHSMLQKYYPYEVHGLNWNDGALNYDYNKTIYFSCDYETEDCETLTIVEIWVDFKNNSIEICTDSSIDEENSVSIKTKQISEQAIKEAIKSFLEKMKL